MVSTSLKGYLRHYLCESSSNAIKRVLVTLQITRGQSIKPHGPHSHRPGRVSRCNAGNSREIPSFVCTMYILTALGRLLGIKAWCVENVNSEVQYYYRHYTYKMVYNSNNDSTFLFCSVRDIKYILISFVDKYQNFSRKEKKMFLFSCLNIWANTIDVTYRFTYYLLFNVLI